jgi:hypothetical protein
VSEWLALLCVPNGHQTRSGISCDGKNLRRWHSKNAKYKGTGFELLSTRGFSVVLPIFSQSNSVPKNKKTGWPNQKTTAPAREEAPMCVCVCEGGGGGELGWAWPY